ncbi:NACHT, LRR and PYD domains-containing protein 12-like [Chanos chanos]|uniref:NACHT, LRR and PYD domains-containing protein 12-like n=1 Tax=Chanos chanos TaxID=29144 RepID=A0A6J2WLH3_CHACN|nr:NACHT, LRR and PYD domains-containing protein 12-like [Chanos chanos]
MYNIPLSASHSAQQDRSDSPVPSCVSMKSDGSMGPPPAFREGGIPDDQSIKKEETQTEMSSFHSDQNLKDVNSIFEILERKMINFVKSELKSFQRIVSEDISECFDGLKEDEISAREGVLKITLHFLRNMNHTDLADKLEKSKIPIIGIQHGLKSKLKANFQCVFEGIAKQGNPTLLNKIFTELYITEGGSGEVNNEHEVRQIEIACSRQETGDTPIQCNDIFKPLPGQDKPIRTVLTKGIAGIGKTVSVQKFILDWVEGKANQDIKFIFPLPFRELNLKNGEHHSLKDILHDFFPETKELMFSNYDKNKVMFIFDGLDECQFRLDFRNNRVLCNVTEKTSVDVLLTNLMKGNLLRSSLLWITSRPAAANLIPPQCVDQVTEVRGFNDPQKEEYFRKRISDQSLANRIITHIKSTRSLHIMCHIPVFCWISATVLERIFTEAESGEIPQTLTQMYTHFLIFQTKQRNQKYDGHYEMDPHWNKENILSLGKLAFEQLKKGNLIFYEKDLKECGIDVREASVYSGLCTEIFREESGLYLGKVFCFVHLSIQEFLAALYVFLTFTNNNVSLLSTQKSLIISIGKSFRGKHIFSLHKDAIDRALESENGHLDLFLRFLLGLSLESSQAFLQGLQDEKGRGSLSKEETVKYIKEKIRENLSPERSINLFHCLNELNDYSLVEEVQSYLSSGSLSRVELSPAEWSALVFVLLTSEKALNVFDLKKFIRSDECLLGLLPVIKASTNTLLDSCNLTETSCSALARILSSTSSCVTKLNLSDNNLQDSGVMLLSAGLGDPHCKLRTLGLSECYMTAESCESLSAALISNPAHLRELNCSENNLGDSGMKPFSSFLKSPQCKMEKLILSNCRIKEEGFAVLTSALGSNPSHLRELNLSGNKTGHSGMRVLSDLLKNPQFKLEKLELSDCNITQEGFADFASALSSNPSYLRVLNLNENKPGDMGVKLLSDPLRNPHCELKELKICNCSITEKGFEALASALSSNPSHLRVLDLSRNKIGDSGMKLLADVVKNSHCKLEKLMFSDCSIREEGYAALASALRSNPSHLRELDLRGNDPGDSGVRLLFESLKNPHCKLEILRLHNCDLTERSCSLLATVLSSVSSSVRELDLSNNNLQDLGVKLLCVGLENTHCKLEILNLSNCNITEEGCAALGSALRCNPSHLKELNLSNNKPGDSGLKLLSEVVKNEHCKLEKLQLCNCSIKERGYATLASALRSNPSHLRELDLRGNDPGDSGVRLLHGLLEDHHCKLGTLGLSMCSITEEDCDNLASALRSNPSHLRELDLSHNKPGDDGVKKLSALLKSPHFKLEKLDLSNCGTTEEGCADLVLALCSNPSYLKELNLTRNELGDSGVKHLSSLLPDCRLEKLNVSDCGITEEGCASLASALTSNPSHLRELNLSRNNTGDSAVKKLSDLLKDSRCKLEKLELCNCKITEEGCANLASALSSNPSRLRELNLLGNKRRKSTEEQLFALVEDPHCKLEKLK